MITVSCEHLSCSYPYGKKEKREVLHDLSVSFEKGKINVIVGPSGCGKTTLVKALCGLLDPDSGKILFDDTDVTRYTIRDRNVSLVNQNIVLYPHMTVFNNIAHPLYHTRAGAEETRRRVYEAAEMMKVSALLSRKPKELSIGQAQRVAIARAVIKRPNAYFFDEPFSNLDRETAVEIRMELKRLLSAMNATVVFITHDIAEAMSFGDYVYAMDEGKIAEKIESTRMMEATSPILQELIKDGFNG